MIKQLEKEFTHTLLTSLTLLILLALLAGCNVHNELSPGQASGEFLSSEVIIGDLDWKEACSKKSVGSLWLRQFPKSMV